jgi:nucleotide-binding universal stress UspA family protein
VTAAFGGSEGLVDAAAAVAARLGAPLRVASFAVAVRASGAADLVERWLQELETAASRAPTVVGHGASWEEAIDDVPWRDGDVLVVGSRSAAPPARVFLGSRASRIIRHSPVPVLVVPRQDADDPQHGVPGACRRPPPSAGRPSHRTAAHPDVSPAPRSPRCHQQVATAPRAFAAASRGMKLRRGSCWSVRGAG